MAAILFAAACMTACSSDNDATADNNVTPKQEGKYMLKGTISLGGNSQTRAVDATGHAYWTTDEEIKIYYQSGTGWANVTARMGRDGSTDISGNFVFEVAITEQPSHNGEVRVVYPASVAYDPVAGTFTTNGLTTDQKGTLADISRYWDIAIGTGAMNVNDNTATIPNLVTLDNKLCILGFDLIDANNQPINATQIEIHMEDHGANFTPVDYTVSPGSNASASTYYVAMKPVKNSNSLYLYFYITATTVGSESKYESLFVRDNMRLIAGNFYKKTLKMYKAGEAVDIGMPSGLKWASSDVGAAKIIDRGLFYAWGETEGHDNSIILNEGSRTEGRAADGYSFGFGDNYKWSKADEPMTMTKYNYTNDSYPGQEGFQWITLEAEDDAAASTWGNSWRMPGYDDAREFLSSQGNFDRRDYWYGGYYHGILFTHKTSGNWIYLPCAGERNGTGISGYGIKAIYWLNRLDYSNTPNNTRAYWMKIGFSGENGLSTYLRNYGLTIRPVHD